MNLKQFNILLADDDIDDCVFFKQVINELFLPINFTTVHDGEQLMHKLNNQNYQLPNVLFLDLNMPRKNGFECLSEIKLDEKLKQLPVIVYSTSFEQDVVNQLYLYEAHYFIRKPSEFNQLKKIIHQTITQIISELNSNVILKITQPKKENFVIILEK